MAASTQMFDQTAVPHGPARLTPKMNHYETVPILGDPRLPGLLCSWPALQGLPNNEQGSPGSLGQSPSHSPMTKVLPGLVPHCGAWFESAPPGVPQEKELHAMVI